MPNIATSWVRDLESVVDAGASLVILSDRSVSLSSASARAYVFKRIKARAGEVVKVRYKVSVASGQCGVSIDYPSAGLSGALRTHSNPGVEEHELVFAVPDIALNTDYIQIALGNFTGYTSSCIFYDISISVENNKMPVPVVHGCGVISVNVGMLGAVALSPDFASSGIDLAHFATQSASITLQIKLSDCVAAAKSAPVILASSHGFNDRFNVGAVGGAYNRSTGIATIKFVDNTTWTIKDITTIPAPADFYFSFMALGY